MGPGAHRVADTGVDELIGLTIGPCGPSTGSPRRRSSRERIADDALRAWARERLGPDPYDGGQYNDQYGVVSIDFDTDAHDVYQRHGSYGRSKYRIRHYASNSAAFLERKLRTRLFLSNGGRGDQRGNFRSAAENLALQDLNRGNYPFKVVSTPRSGLCTTGCIHAPNLHLRGRAVGR
jgi:hypothetical protein